MAAMTLSRSKSLVLMPIPGIWNPKLKGPVLIIFLAEQSHSSQFLK